MEGPQITRKQAANTRKRKGSFLAEPASTKCHASPLQQQESADLDRLVDSSGHTPYKFEVRDYPLVALQLI
jgi:hypothetical protein